VVRPPGVHLSIAPACASDRPQHANVVDPCIAQCLEISLETGSIELESPRTPEEGCAKSIKRAVRIRNRVLLGAYRAGWNFAAGIWHGSLVPHSGAWYRPESGRTDKND
jgi:hypothetical protein